MPEHLYPIWEELIILKKPNEDDFLECMYHGYSATLSLVKQLGHFKLGQTAGQEAWSRSLVKPEPIEA
jgi:hypothetical protein